MFNLSLFRKELREHRWALLVGTILLCGMGIFTAWSFKMISMYGNIFTEYFKPDLMEQFIPMLENYTHYVWSQWHPKNLLQVGTILALVLASPSIAGEVNRGSIKYLTSLPITRKTILLSKAMAGAISLSAIIWAATLVLLAAASILNPEILWGKILAATILSNVGLIAVYAFGMIFSSLGSDSVKSGAMAAAALFVWSAAGLHPATRVLSPFWHMKGVPWFTGTGPFPWLSLIGLALLAIAALFIANHIFSKRQF